MKPKQVIVMRKDLKMRRGKEIAQGSHASCMFLAHLLQSGEKPSEVQFIWINERFTKITLQVNSEQELEEIHQKALAAGLLSNMVVDSGLTEFHGVPTKTCLALGPDFPDKIDPITGSLSLY